MADDSDQRSLHLVARVGGLVVGAARLIRCTVQADRFMFEKEIPFSAVTQEERGDFLEISRVAIAREFQRRSVFAALVTAVAREVIRGGYQFALCLARTAQRACYSKCGFRTVSREILHPPLS